MEQIVSLYVCNMLSIVGWNVWSESNGRHLINPPGEREHHFYSGDGSDNGTDVFPSRLRVTAYFQVLWLAVRERCYSCVWVFVFAARSPTKIVRNTAYGIGDDSKTSLLSPSNFALPVGFYKRKRKRKHLLYTRSVFPCLFARIVHAPPNTLRESQRRKSSIRGGHKNRRLLFTAAIKLFLFYLRKRKKGNKKGKEKCAILLSGKAPPS